MMSAAYLPLTKGKGNFLPVLNCVHQIAKELVVSQGEAKHVILTHCFVMFLIT